MRATTTRLVAVAGLTGLLGTLAAVGCGAPPVACETDGDCGAASRCELESKACVQRTEDTSCSPACAEWQFCNQGACYDRYQALAVLQPSSQAVVNGSAVVRAQLQPVAAWIAARPHARLVYAVNQGPTLVNEGDLLPAGDGGTYSGQIAVGAAGQYTLRAGFPSFPAGAPVSGEVPITVDVMAPTFRVDAGTRGGLSTGTLNEQDPLLADAFKRNDVVTVSIESDDADLDPGTVALTVQGVDAGTQTPFAVSVGSGCGAAHCWSAMVDLATVEMWALRGRMTARVEGRDNAGNLGQGMVQIPVTRFKWSRSMPFSAAISASPAVGAQGTIYVATNAGGASTLSAIRPDGTEQWASPVSFPAAILASPAVGKGDGSEEVIYAFPNRTPPTMYAFFGIDGGVATAAAPPTVAGRLTASPLIAQTRAGSTDIRESATSFANGSPDFSLVTLRFGTSTSANKSGDGGTAPYPGNIVGEDNLAFAADNTQRIHEYSFTGNWEETAPLRMTTGAAIGLALSPNLVVGSSAGAVFAFPRASGTNFSRTELSPSIPSLIGTDLVYSEGNTLNAIRITPTGSATPTISSLGTTTTTPLVGTGGITYFVGTDNSLHLLDSGLAKIWSGTVEPTIVVASSPNIDCARTSGGAKLPGSGTLYYGADNGNLYAIIVDNPGIDTTSPWPKYQHDPRNTGSLSTPLSEFACP